MSLPRPVDSDATINAAIHAYEDRVGDLGEHTRAALRTARRMELMEAPRTPTHPLGHHADPAEDHCTPRNRADIKRCLWQYWDNGRPVREPYRATPLALQVDDQGGVLADQVNQRQETAMGYALADRIVSRFDLGSALNWLARARSDDLTILERTFRLGWTEDRFVREEHYTDRTYRRHLTSAVDAVIRIVYRDSWTEAKSQDMSEERNDIR